MVSLCLSISQLPIFAYQEVAWIEGSNGINSKIKSKMKSKMKSKTIREILLLADSALNVIGTKAASGFHAPSTKSTNRQRTQLRPQAGLNMLLMLDLVAVTAVVVWAFNALEESSVLPVL